MKKKENNYKKKEKRKQKILQEKLISLTIFREK